nr:MAG TPA: hypothetical protein [Caudoviricetes sp.]
MIQYLPARGLERSGSDFPNSLKQLQNKRGEKK